jgi:lipid-binding SYLF domain-containing protein
MQLVEMERFTKTEASWQMAKLTQISIGFQAGGQSFRKVIFFEIQESFERFKENKIEFAAQVSAVAAASGASARYQVH